MAFKQAKRDGVEISFIEYAGTGVPVTVASLLLPIRWNRVSGHIGISVFAHNWFFKNENLALRKAII